MFKTLIASHSYKAKISALEFVMTFTFTNFMALCLNETFVRDIEEIIVEMLKDEHIQVRNTLFL